MESYRDYNEIYTMVCSFETVFLQCDYQLYSLWFLQSGLLLFSKARFVMERLLFKTDMKSSCCAVRNESALFCFVPELFDFVPEMLTFICFSGSIK